jgi:DNA-binding CsgD family transcriptional regulator
MALHTATERELIFRPKQGRDYLALAIGLVVLAGALGIVSGSTASVCTEDSMRALNSLVTEDSVLFALLCVIILAVRADRFDWMSLIRLMPSLMLIAVLMNIPFVGYSDIWLSLTLFGWNAVRLLVFLFIIEVARKRIVSLSLIYPVAWSLLMAGHACGIVISQAFLPASIGMFDFMSSVVLVAVLAACSSMFILSNKLVLGLMASSQLPAEHAGSMPDAAAPSNAKQSSPIPPTMPENARLASPAPQEDPLPFAARCHALAQSHHLSSREEEVMMLLARGNTRANIAKRLFISENTVRAHVKSIYAKLYIHSRQQLINLVDLPGNLR